MAKAYGTITFMTMREIRSNALGLPATERAALAHELLISLDESEDPNAEGLWVAEIERRAHDVAGGKVSLIAADDVHADAAKLLRTRTAR